MEVEYSEDRVPCNICGRSFAPEVLAKHSNVCKKSAASAAKRKIFDSSKQRVLEGELSLKQIKEAQKKDIKPPKSHWREKHQDFINAVRNARGLTQAIASGGPLPPPPPPSLNPDYIQCPHCARRFGQQAADRHISFCKDKQALRPKEKSTSKPTGKENTRFQPPKPRSKTTPAPSSANIPQTHASDVAGHMPAPAKKPLNRPASSSKVPPQAPTSAGKASPAKQAPATKMVPTRPTLSAKAPTSAQVPSAKGTISAQVPSTRGPNLVQVPSTRGPNSAQTSSSSKLQSTGPNSALKQPSSGPNSAIKPPSSGANSSTPLPVGDQTHTTNPPSTKIPTGNPSTSSTRIPAPSSRIPSAIPAAASRIPVGGAASSTRIPVGGIARGRTLTAPSQRS